MLPSGEPPARWFTESELFSLAVQADPLPPNSTHNLILTLHKPSRRLTRPDVLELDVPGQRAEERDPAPDPDGHPGDDDTGDESPPLGTAEW